MGRLERNVREILTLLMDAAGRMAAWERLRSLLADPGSALDSLIIRDQAKEAGPQTRVHFLLPALGTVLLSLMTLDLVGIAARAAGDLLAVIFLPMVMAWGLPKALLLVDQQGTANFRRWQTYCAHSLVPSLAMAFLARVILPLSPTLSGGCIVMGLILSTRAFLAAPDEWLDLPEDGRLLRGAIYLAYLLLCGSITAFLLDAGLMARSA